MRAMTKRQYRALLRSPEWIKKRDKIKKRDNYKCRECKKEGLLHVHHTYYLQDKLPWQVPDSCLITLCPKCHKKAHKGKKISTFLKKN